MLRFSKLFSEYLHVKGGDVLKPNRLGVYNTEKYLILPWLCFKWPMDYNCGVEKNPLCENLGKFVVDL